MFRPEILKMAGYQSGEQLEGPDVIKLNTNENPYPASPKVVEAIERTARAGLQRYPSASAAPFREAAAQRLGVDPDWIICGNGSDDVLTFVTRALVGQGQLLRLPYPSYVLYATLAEIQGARYDEVPFARDWSLTEAFFAPEEDLRLAFLPNPNSPSGTLIPKERLREVAERLPCPLLIDEAYAEFAGESCIDLVRENERVMVSRTMSKAYALAGLRFGYLVAQPHVIEQLTKVRDSYNCDALAIAAATAAIGDSAWLSATREKILATRGRLTSEMRALGFQVAPSQANFTWNTHPDLPLRPIYEHLKAHRILVRYMNYPYWGEGLRISVGTDEQTDACLARVREIVEEL